MIDLLPYAVMLLAVITIYAIVYEMRNAFKRWAEGQVTRFLSDYAKILSANNCVLCSSLIYSANIAVDKEHVIAQVNEIAKAWNQ